MTIFPNTNLFRNICRYEDYSDSTWTNYDLRVHRCEARICASFSASLHWARTCTAFNERFPSRHLKCILNFFFYAMFRLPDCSKAFHQMPNIHNSVFLPRKFPDDYFDAATVIFNLITYYKLIKCWLISVVYLPYKQS